MRDARVFDGGNAKEEHCSDFVSARQIERLANTAHALERMDSKSAPACAESVRLRQQVEVAERYPRIRLAARRVLWRRRDDHARSIAEHNVVAAHDLSHVAAKLREENLRNAGADQSLQVSCHLAPIPVHLLALAHDREMEPVVVASRRHPGKRVDKPSPDFLRNRIVAPLTSAPTLTQKRRLGASVWNRLNVQRFAKPYVIACDCAACAHGEAVLAIQAVPLVLLSERGISVLVLRQDMNYAVPHAGSTADAFGFIDNYHGEIPPIPFS